MAWRDYVLIMTLTQIVGLPLDLVTVFCQLKFWVEHDTGVVDENVDPRVAYEHQFSLKPT